jgi:hypothetical protein
MIYIFKTKNWHCITFFFFKRNYNVQFADNNIALFYNDTEKVKDIYKIYFPNIKLHIIK